MLQMLGMYLYTQTKLTMLKQLQNPVTNNAFMDKKVKHNNIKTIKSLVGAGNWTRELSQAYVLPLHRRVNWK